MKKETGTWDVRLTNAALSDYREILLWTRQHFGERQAVAYANALDDALAELSDGPALAGAKLREDLGHGLFCCISPATRGGAVTSSRSKFE